MRREFDKIFETFGKLFQLVQVKSRYDEKLEQLRNVRSKRCGNCAHWMKSSCYPEKKLNEFKSMNSFACKDFELSYGSELLIEQFEVELSEIKKELDRFNEANQK